MYAMFRVYVFSPSNFDILNDFLTTAIFIDFDPFPKLFLGYLGAFFAPSIAVEAMIMLLLSIRQ